MDARHRAQLRGLRGFGLSGKEVDASLSRAETMLQSFREELCERFNTFLKGQRLQEGVVHDYTPVFEFVSSFLSRADEQEVKAAAVMRLGAAEDFVHHFQPSGALVSLSPLANAAQAKLVLLQRVVGSVQRQMVKGDFTPEFTLKLQDFYSRLYFPAELSSMTNSLCVRAQDDFLLTSVLKGKNVCGVHRTDVLMEPTSVVLLRTELLQQQNRYRELCRYLQVVQTDDVTVLQQLRDLIPFFKCMDRKLMAAVLSLLPPGDAPATRLTPLLFRFYLRVFKTATAPKLTVTQPVQLCYCDAPWEPIKGAVPLKRTELLKFSLRAQTLCSEVFMDSQCWTRLLSIMNAPRASIRALPAPPPHFLHEAKDVVDFVLHNMDGSNIEIPEFFEQVSVFR
ncbi:uncharacterized protein [Channa argus]|uniref:uncharacterized protein n=1 Tax=Channa argus TaxID=215402 RepID=UPI00351F8A6C